MPFVLTRLVSASVPTFGILTSVPLSARCGAAATVGAYLAAYGCATPVRRYSRDCMICSADRCAGSGVSSPIAAPEPPTN